MSKKQTAEQKTWDEAYARAYEAAISSGQSPNDSASHGGKIAFFETYGWSNP